jgi:hypothetical protein
MNNSPLRKLTIANLRGSVKPFTLAFEKGRKLTIVYGENATGKTTICDALEFLGKGYVGSLENRGLGKAARYWHSVGKSAADVAVTLETSAGACTAKVMKGEVVVVPLANRPQVEVLRRTTIQGLIDGRPADRYALIDPFIDVSGVTNAESSLRGLVRDLKSNRDTAVAIVAENEATLRHFWEAAGKPGSDAIEWCEHESARDAAEFDEERQAVAALRAAYQRLTDYPARAEAVAKQLAEMQGAAATTDEQLAILLSAASEGVGDLVAILEAAQPYFQKHLDPKQCPLCESTEKISGLSARVNERIKQYSAIQKARRDKEALTKTLQAEERRHADLKKDFARDRKAFEVAGAAYKWKTNVQLPNQPCPEALNDLKGWLDANFTNSAGWQKAEAGLQSQSQFVQTLKQALKNYKKNVQEQKDLDKLIPHLETALEIVADERRKFTDSVLAAIAKKVGDLYEAVHPGEGLNKISLVLDPSRRASLEIGASFCGQSDAPPQAYFSQSHIDTLGLCIFLALAGMEKPEDMTLVLDDVLASVDEPHVDRLIQMLYEEAQKFRHCLISTHYRPWKEKHRWGWLKNGQCQFVELTKWTATDGLTVIGTLPDVERLRKLLAETPPDPQIVCAKAGVILEAALDFLTELYECRVPRRRSGYTLGDLLPALDKKLRATLRVDVISAGAPPSYTAVPLAPILDELTQIAQVRNVMGAHFNALSFTLLDSDALGFGKNVLALMDALTDPEAGWPQSKKSGSYWATAGETRRLHPLQQPT